MNTVLTNVISFLEAGARVVNHGGRKTKLLTRSKSGKKVYRIYPTKVVKLANHIRFLMREENRKSKGAVDVANTTLAAGSTNDNAVLETTTVTNSNETV